jgi:hypothetical protein
MVPEKFDVLLKLWQLGKKNQTASVGSSRNGCATIGIS